MDLACIGDQIVIVFMIDFCSLGDMFAIFGVGVEGSGGHDLRNAVVMMNERSCKLLKLFFVIDVDVEVC